MTTLADLRRLLWMARRNKGNPAIMRWPARTVEELARAYLPRRLSCHAREGGCLTADYVGRDSPLLAMDLADPSTAHALLVALALAMGLDPGVSGLGVRWCSATRHHADVWRGDCQLLAAHRTLIWALEADRTVWFAGGTSFFSAHQIDITWMDTPAVASEPDSVRALNLAVAHVLATPPAE